MRFHHIGLEVDQLDEAISFYTRTFGFKVESHFHFMDEEIVFLVSDSIRLELVGSQEETKTAHICFEVSDLEEMMKQLDPKQILEGPYVLENGWETVFYKGANQEIIEFMQTIK